MLLPLCIRLAPGLATLCVGWLAGWLASHAQEGAAVLVIKHVMDNFLMPPCKCTSGCCRIAGTYPLGYSPPASLLEYDLSGA